MTKRRGFVVLVATDGSPEARAAVAATVAFPWPAHTTVYGVLARRRLKTFQRPEYFVVAYDRFFQAAAHAAERTLRRRWPAAAVTIADKWAADAILGQARRLRADAIVLGSRPRGMVARLLLGSVSREVVRASPCSVLVVRGRLAALSRLVIGVDGSRNSHRAVAFVAALSAPSSARVLLVRVVEPLRPPSLALAPTSARRVIAREAAAENADAIRAARRDVARLTKQLRGAGWHVRSMVRLGHPLPELLHVARSSRAQLLVIGARGVGGVDRLLLGSVAEGVLNRARVSVLLAR